MANRNCTWFDNMFKTIGILAIVGAILIGSYKFYFSKHYSILKNDTARQLGISTK